MERHWSPSTKVVRPCFALFLTCQQLVRRIGMFVLSSSCHNWNTGPVPFFNNMKRVLDSQKYLTSLASFNHGKPQIDWIVPTELEQTINALSEFKCAGFLDTTKWFVIPMDTIGKQLCLSLHQVLLVTGQLLLGQNSAAHDDCSMEQSY